LTKIFVDMNYCMQWRTGIQWGFVGSNPGPKGWWTKRP